MVGAAVGDVEQGQPRLRAGLAQLVQPAYLRRGKPLSMCVGMERLIEGRSEALLDPHFLSSWMSSSVQRAPSPGRSLSSGGLGRLSCFGSGSTLKRGVGHTGSRIVRSGRPAADTAGLLRTQGSEPSASSHINQARPLPAEALVRAENMHGINEKLVNSNDDELESS